MKNLVFICLFYLPITPIISHSQITVTKKDGGSVITKLGMGFKVNGNSTLNREWITLSDASCPAQLNDVGIETNYSSPSYTFKSVGVFVQKEDITAFEVHHVLYDVFGDHIKTLSMTEVSDLTTANFSLSKASWYASEGQVREFLISVSYIANVRKKDGTIWRYNYKLIKDKLDDLKIAFEEKYLPQKDVEKGKN